MPVYYPILCLLLVAICLPVIADSSPPVSGQQSLELSPSQDKIIAIDSLASFFSVVSMANKRYQYASLLTYEANGYITTFKLNHLVDNETVYQQLVFMDGPQRQVFRQQGLSRCGQGQTRWGLWPTALSNASQGAYSLKAVGYERIANRKALIFDILPKDEHRYGYRYSIDQQTGLVLKVMTFYKKAIVERLQTVTLAFIEEEQSLAFDKTAAYVWRVPEVDPCHAEQFQSGWRVGWLPEGFDAVGNRVTSKGEQVLIFADGLVSVSIFVMNKNAAGLAKATARHGATVVVVAPVLSKPERRIAVVGEIPVSTARRIAVSVSSQ